MIRIKMISKAAGPQGVYEPGRIYEVDDELGRAFVAIGAAENVQPVEEAIAPPAETAVTRKKGKA